MTSRDFCYWLQGYFELSDEKIMSEHQIDCIKKHLALVFIHEIDPSAGDQKHQDALNEVHNAGHNHDSSFIVKPTKSAFPVIHNPEGTLYRC